MNLDSLSTEQPHPYSFPLDQMSTLEAVTLMHRMNEEVLLAVERELPLIAQTIDRIAKAFREGGRLFYVGAGTSGRLGVIDAVECVPTFSADPEMVQGILAGGPEAMWQSIEGAEDDTEAGVQEIRWRKVGPRDVVVGISASGRTPFVLSAMREAKAQGATVVGLANNRPCAMMEVADWCILPETGPEILSGSTRLKAGTAQKIILNMLSTLAMVKIGKTYGNLMVDLKATNTKLRRRAERLVQLATQCSEDEARSALEASGYRAKVAIVMIIGQVSAQEAESLLEKNQGFVSQALEEAKSLRRDQTSPLL